MLHVIKYQSLDSLPHIDQAHEDLIIVGAACTSSAVLLTRQHAVAHIGP